jgi:Serine carboxypeptidase S28
VTDDYAKAHPSCPIMMKAGFLILSELSSKPESYQAISEIFNLCSVPSDANDIYNLYNTVNSSLTSMAMVDYPYPTSFLAPLPAWPVKYACDQALESFEQHKGDKYADLYAMAAAGSTFYNYDNQIECLDTSASSQS